MSPVMPGISASFGAMSCFSRSLTIRSSISWMFRRRPSIFFWLSTTGTSVTMPSAESSRLPILRSRSSRVSVQIGRTRKSLLDGSLRASPRLRAVSLRMLSIAFIRRCACSKAASPSRGSLAGGWVGDWALGADAPGAAAGGWVLPAGGGVPWATRWPPRSRLMISAMESRSSPKAAPPAGNTTAAATKHPMINPRISAPPSP